MASSTNRAGSSLFHAFVGVGVAVALGLAIHEAGDKPPVEVVETFEEVRHNEAWVIEADVHNRSDEPRCPEIRIAARDTETRDLAEEVAQPTSGEVSLAPGATARYRAVILDLTEEEYTEELEEFAAYVYDTGSCEPGSSS